METMLWLFAAVIIGLFYQAMKDRVKRLEERLGQRENAHAQLLTQVEELRAELWLLKATPPAARPATPDVPRTVAAPVAPATAVAPALVSPTPQITPPVTAPTPVALPAVAPVPPIPPTAPALPVPPKPMQPPVAAPVPAVPVAATTPAAPVAQPAPPTAAPLPKPQPEPVFTPPAPPVPAEPAGPTWWQRTEQLLLDNWTGILGAVVLVTGVGFLGVYTALQVTPPVRFAMISAFAGVLLGLNYYLRNKPFAERLHVWLQSSAAAIFLFACVGAVSVPGLRWATPPLSYLLLLAGVAANLWLAWRSSRESVATLHGVLSLVALSTIAPDLLTLATAAGVTAFCIAITYRQRWKYQLLLSILSFFVFHQYWHFHLAAPLGSGLRLVAMALVLLVGVAAAIVQYRRVYAHTQFDALLFAAHVLNWTTLGFNLYQYSTGSPWKTIPLALGAVLTFFVARRARQLGIQWLFQTDTIISLILALATAFSLQGWHATGPIVGLFMLLESLLIAFIMAREQETLVFRVAAAGALLAGTGLLLMVLTQLAHYTPTELHRNALVVFLAASLGAGYFRLTAAHPVFENEADGAATNRALHQGFGGLVGALYLGVAVLLLQALFGVSNPPAGALIGAAAAVSGVVFGLAHWLRGGPTWFRTLHLAAGQVLLTVAMLGLHKLGLVWPATAAVLYLEMLLLAWLLARATETAAFRLLTGGALLAGGWLLLTSVAHWSHLLPANLHRNAALLLGVGLASAVFFRQLERQLWLSAQVAQSPDRSLHHSTGGLTGLLYLGGVRLLLQALFGVSSPPVAVLVGSAALLGGGLLALTRWLRGGAEWFRVLHLLAGQLLLSVAVLGLHKAGLSWPLTQVLLYFEMLLMTLALAWRREWWTYRVLLYATLLLAVGLPMLVYGTGHLSAEQRALLLTLAALATAAAQAAVVRLEAPAYDALPFAYNPAYRLRVLGTVPGVLLLTAAGLVYEHTWAAWAAAGLGAALLLLRRYVVVPGLWTGVLLATTAYHLLQWHEVLVADSNRTTGSALGYLLPLVLLAGVGLACSWWTARARQVRWPWLYLLGLHLTVAAWAAAAPHSEALAVLLWTTLATLAAAAAHQVRQRLTDPDKLTRAGQPDRFLLHITYGLLLWAMLWHFGKLVPSTELLWQVRGRRLTAAALVLVLAALAWRRAPTTGPRYRTWQWLHPYLPELTLLFLGFTLWWEVQLTWQALLCLALAFGLTLGGARLPARLRRLQLYGVLFFWLSTLWASYVALRYLAPGQLLSVRWLTTAGAVALQFAYAALALQLPARPEHLIWPPGLAGLAALGRLSFRQLVAALLYPAFLALTVLLVQSFDRSVLTVLLMLEVVALFVSSLLLRRQDFRYASLAGVAICLVRLVFFDLSQRGTITRAVVFILMGILLLGMNALYARFKDRFAPVTSNDDSPATEPELPTAPDTAQPE
ncbi:DUF2339 domain-containing protein [Hymenobacter lucidus]|uniref:DUF2339 domain-containing protein n=1 Tax=Hymenobacter lucidus TaxID=2880930 RepID=A0ABS8AS78_9BACT|nr:DUF2339 domain-containing protein [Hymenobacter lucidus]MCB2408604.1 DUF2339 domain-containing protein [Hymenobacter lucidus]